MSSGGISQGACEGKGEIRVSLHCAANGQRTVRLFGASVGMTAIPGGGRLPLPREQRVVRGCYTSGASSGTCTGALESPIPQVRL
jgi:hypothetical protein